MSFQIRSLPKSLFEHLFRLSAEELTSQRAIRLIATKNPGFPCRVSLTDAEIGEEVLLVNYQHQCGETPFRSSHAVYVRVTARQTDPRPDEVPEMLRSRILSLRAFDRSDLLIGADLVEGTAIEAAIEAMFQDSLVAYLHLHFAKPGCYAARADRGESLRNSGGQ